jgi:hypothetical protein
MTNVRRFVEPRPFSATILPSAYHREPLWHCSNASGVVSRADIPPPIQSARSISTTDVRPRATAVLRSATLRCAVAQRVAHVRQIISRGRPRHFICGLRKKGAHSCRRIHVVSVMAEPASVLSLPPSLAGQSACTWPQHTHAVESFACLSHNLPSVPALTPSAAHSASLNTTAVLAVGLFALESTRELHPGNAHPWAGRPSASTGS